MEDSDTRKKISLSPYIKAVQLVKQPPFTKNDVRLFKVAVFDCWEKEG